VSTDADPDAGVTEPRSGGARRSRAGRAAVAELRQVLRDPLLLVLVVVLPGYFVGVWGWIVPDEPITVPIAGGAGVVDHQVPLPELIAAVIAPLAGALVVGITGLFAVQRARDVDARLGVAGYRPSELLAGRLAVLGAIGIVVTGVGVGVARLHVVPAHPAWFVLAVGLACGIYGAIGSVLGQVLDRLPGVYFLLFAPMIDMMLLQNPLADPPAWAAWLPGHHPIRLATSAAFAETVAIEHALWGGVAVVGAVTLAAAATTLRMR